MARRTELRGICDGLLAKFISRNNDLNGYWALGQFVKILHQTPDATLEISLMDATPRDARPKIAETGAYYSHVLKKMMERQGVPLPWLGHGKISLEINDTDYLDCAVSLVSDLGREFRSEAKLRVHPHDPAREHRRAPNDWTIICEEV